jgi:hypothetical protein
MNARKIPKLIAFVPNNTLRYADAIIKPMAMPVMPIVPESLIL